MAQIEWEDETPRVRLDDVFYPSEFIATSVRADHVVRGLFKVQTDGTPSCVALGFETDDDRPIQQALLKDFRLSDFVDDAMRHAGEVIRRENPDGTFFGGRLVHADQDVQVRARAGYRRRRRSMTDDHLRTVAAVYRESIDGGAPTEAVAERFNTSRSTAGRWVQEARQRGFLGATRRGVMGEATGEVD